ncbi:alpha/beta hydrolase [Halomarina pelagica]|uniref:alpha/beta hydrolase n=1 Tax=Halomarina pelagica TaxID=2961599 RepID=UPI0020C46411|nr:alpha/beta hydrolase [Halomarina sp. BND7]
MTRTFEEIGADDGTRLRLWRRGVDNASAVLFVHGATYPGRSVFALAADPGGESWLAACARAGWAAYAIDLRGYGDSEAPSELDAPPAANEPVVRADVAAEDVAAALATLLDRHERVHLVGYSWGSMVCGRLLASRAVEVASLTQFAPVHAFPDGADDLLDGDPDAYRVVTAPEVRDRWDAQFPAGVAPSSYRSEGTVEAFWRSLRDSGQAADRNGAPAVRAPNGTLADMAAAAAGTPAYDPAAIDAPALVVRGSFDATATRADALGLYDALGAAGRREYAEVAGGTHFLTLERRRTALFDIVSGFQRRYE